MTDPLLSVEDHRDRILAAIRPLPAFDQPLMEAFGLSAAEDVHAEVALPGFDNSAMDGYAVCHADVAAATEESPVHLPVVGGHQQHRLGRKHVEQVAHEQVGRRELPGVELVVQPVGVGHLVDARVIGVHELLARRDEPPAVLDERRDGLPTDERRTTEVRLRETRITKFEARDHRYRPPEKGVVTLNGERVGRGPGLCLPAQHVEHVVADEHAEAEDAVMRGREAGRDRCERGRRRRGSDGRDLGAVHRSQLAQDLRPGLDLVGAEPVEHEQHDARRVAHRVGHPRRRTSADERRDQARHRGPVERRDHRLRFHRSQAKGPSGRSRSSQCGPAR